MSEGAHELQLPAEQAADFEVVVIGAGQAGLAMGYYLAQQGDASSSSNGAIQLHRHGESAGVADALHVAAIQRLAWSPVPG
jgi:glycine/D-amino acid oxidase-like deaminating enzyme